MASPFPSFLAE
ncbi:hypothetical protein Zm00014a_003390 [Zea mays]|uniref:Uncharacterized protein n=2 Tax=Zea mays TaxID=4577 RepID=A0A3L6F8H3_MAIZE|nr:hypothetical protein Zm00014a_003390 [Zea mays]